METYPLNEFDANAVPPILDTSYIQFGERQDRLAMQSLFSKFCRAFNAGISFEIVFADGPGHEGTLYGTDLYEAVVRLRNGLAMPLPVFEEAAGIEIEYSVDEDFLDRKTWKPNITLGDIIADLTEGNVVHLCTGFVFDSKYYAQTIDQFGDHWPW